MGGLRKMEARAGPPVRYALPIGERRLLLNPLLGQRMRLTFSGEVRCIACGRATRRSYCQGHCYPCSRRLARCDLCILRPERCHYRHGTCREPAWGEAHCMRAHYVYLANSSGLKVGITRANQIPVRWLDQGATQALPIFEVTSRHHSGLVEEVLGRVVSDRTDWRAMLRGPAAPLDLEAEREALLERCAAGLEGLAAELSGEPLVLLRSARSASFEYPVLRYPEAPRALDLDNTSEIEGMLLGIKGQYLILDCGVLNVRKWTGYQIALSV